MSNIAKWLSVFSAISWNYPKPDSPISITASGSPIWYQWYAGSQVLNMIKISNWWKDPLDATTYYTYSTNVAQNKFQILGFLEDWSNSSISMSPGFFIKPGLELAEADPSSYSWRYVITKWDQLWILLDASTKVPLQTLNWSIDVVLTNWNYIAQFTSKEKVTWTWYAINIIKSTMVNWGSKFPWCDQYNIIVWSQTWAGCNSTLWSWFEFWYADNWSTGSVLSCYSYNSTSTILNCPIWDISMASTTREKSWSVANLVNWVVDNMWWKLYTWNQAGSACPVGWHLPTDKEWINLETTLACTDWSVDDNWRCSWLGWYWNNTNGIIQTLKIPLSWYRVAWDVQFNQRWYGAYMWSSTASWSTSSFSRGFLYDRPTVFRKTYANSIGFSVRCLKD
jgi:uncharacterized protein (TIGR02145 family)